MNGQPQDRLMAAEIERSTRSPSEHLTQNSELTWWEEEEGQEEHRGSAQEEGVPDPHLEG